MLCITLYTLLIKKTLHKWGMGTGHKPLNSFAFEFFERYESDDIAATLFIILLDCLVNIS